jgi:hypothetical protein
VFAIDLQAGISEVQRVRRGCRRFPVLARARAPAGDAGLADLGMRFQFSERSLAFVRHLRALIAAQEEPCRAAREAKGKSEGRTQSDFDWCVEGKSLAVVQIEEEHAAWPILGKQRQSAAVDGHPFSRE